MKLKTLLMTIGLGFWMTASHSAKAEESSAAALHRADLVQTLEKSGSFKTLAAALKSVDLVGTLEGAGPYTVLAPTDAAFAKLGEGAVDKLLAQPELLKQILLYHVVPGNVSLRQAFKAGKAETVNGSSVSFERKARGFYVNDARILRANVRASNGTIHVIDKVLLPPAKEAKDIVAIASANPKFSTLVTVLKAADLVSVLQGKGPFTVFAPTNEAFAKLGADAIKDLLADKEKLRSVLLYHVIKGAAVDFSAASLLTEANTANGQKVTITFADGQLKIDDARVIMKDVKASNGIIHVIDSVLIPE